MKIRKDEQGVLYVQIEPNERYCVLFHRLNKDKYEQYINRKHKIYVLNNEELKQIRDYIQSTEVKDAYKRSKRGTKKVSVETSRKDKGISKEISSKEQRKDSV